MYNKESFQSELEFNADEMVRQQKKEHQEMLDTFQKILMPKIEKIVKWHQSSNDKHLIPDIYRELLIGWYFTNKGLAINWIDKEINSIQNIY